VSQTRGKGLLPFLLIPFLLLATANSAGYRFGASDQAFYAPAAMQRLDPALFPRDTALLDAQARLTFADETIATIVRMTGGRLRLPPLFVALFVLTLGLVAAAALRFGGLLFQDRWSAVALLAALSLRHGIAKSGTNTLEGYFHPRQLAFAFGALAVCAFMKRRYGVLLCLLAAAGALHPTTTLWFTIWLYVAAIVAEPRWRTALSYAVVAAVPVAWWTFSAGPLAGRLTVIDAEWLAALADKDYLFPFRWPAYAWALNLGYALVIGVVWRLRRSAGELRERETAVVVGCLSLLAVFVGALVLQSRGIALAIQLQPARIFWMLDFLAVAYLVWLVAESGDVARHARAIGLVIVLTAASAARGLYIMNVLFPDRPFCQIEIPDDDWGRVMAWARTTDTASGWLADPAHAVSFGTSIRVAAERDVFVEATKDSALGMYERAIAIRTRDRLRELPDFDSLTSLRARELGASYNLDFLVTARPLDLPVAFESGGLRVYRIR
jgi:hypothetical protein